MLGSEGGELWGVCQLGDGGRDKLAAGTAADVPNVAVLDGMYLDALVTKHLGTSMMEIVGVTTE
ncbi:MAG: hypothetical protein Q9224_004142 [Gallowayella concinna]